MKPLLRLLVVLLVGLLPVTLTGCLPQENPMKTLTVERSQSLNDAVDSLWASGEGSIVIADHVPGDWTHVTLMSEGANLAELASRYGLDLGANTRRFTGTNLLVFTQGDALVRLDQIDGDVIARDAYGRPLGREVALQGNGVRKLLTVVNA